MDEAEAEAENAKATIIAELAVNAPTDAVRNCIRIYDCKETLRNIEKKMNSISKPTIVETLKYLQCPNMDKYIKERCIHELVCRIQNLLPDECKICNSKYTVKLDETPILVCVICGQGCHNDCILPLLNLTNDEYTNMTQEDIQKTINPLEIPGFFYICPPCQIETVPSKETGLSKKAGKSKKAKNVTISVQENKAKQNDTESENQANKSDDESSTNDTDSDPSDSDNDSDDDEAISSSTSSDNSEEENASQKSKKKKKLTKKSTKSKKPTDKTPDKKPTCRFYRKGNCRHGTSGHTNGDCAYDHPKPCKKLLANGNRGPKGCQAGKECKFFHPRMCQDSLKHRICLNQNCTYRHVSNTKRELAVNPNSRASSPTGYTGMQNERQNGFFQMQNAATNSPVANNNNADSFLGALTILKRELMESMDQKIQSLVNLPQMRYQLEYPQLGTQIKQAPQMQPNMYQSRLVQQTQPMQVTNQHMNNF